MTWPLHHIRWKIVLPYAFLTVVLAVTGSYLATKMVTSSLAERFENQLTEAGRVVADSVVRKEREHLETVRAVAFTEGVAGAVRAGDAGRIVELVGPIAGNAAVERLEILNSQGQRLEKKRLAAHPVGTGFAVLARPSRLRKSRNVPMISGSHCLPAPSDS